MMAHVYTCGGAFFFTSHTQLWLSFTQLLRGFMEFIMLLCHHNVQGIPRWRLNP